MVSHILKIGLLATPLNNMQEFARRAAAYIPHCNTTYQIDDRPQLYSLLRNQSIHAIVMPTGAIDLIDKTVRCVQTFFMDEHSFQIITNVNAVITQYYLRDFPLNLV